MDAIEYFKDMRKRLCEDYLKLLPQKSVAYQATLREMSFYDAAIKALEQTELKSSYNRDKTELDAISRQAAIDAIYACYIGGKKAVDKAPYSDHYAEGIDEAVNAVEELPSVSTEKTGRFAKWVADEIFDKNWEYNKDAFAEIACRKLAKLGIVKANGGVWELIEPQESEVQDADSD